MGKSWMQGNPLLGNILVPTNVGSQNTDWVFVLYTESVCGIDSEEIHCVVCTHFLQAICQKFKNVIEQWALKKPQLALF